MSWKCLLCNSENNDSISRCFCGYEIDFVNCTKCGKKVVKGSSFCQNCGEQLTYIEDRSQSLPTTSLLADDHTTFFSAKNVDKYTEVQPTSISLKANKKITAESICKICDAKFSIGEDIKQCEKCQNYFHNRCWEEKGGCNQAGCKEDTKPCPMCGKEIKKSALKCRHCGQFIDEELLKTTQIRDALKKDLRGWGGGLIIMGIISFLLSGFLDPIWGGILIAIGVATLIIQQRGMFIIIGIGLVLAGIMNISAGGGWKIFGFLQIYWGVQEIRKFNKYAISVQPNKELIPD